ncbi:MAG: alpha/beta hydrolase [Ruminococcaceae bacterium]|nr:alpha/beta hydrolase [Oscillospiraceae bacterium]
MLFNEFGSKENKPVILLHGMMQDWHSEYELLKPLEEHYRLIIPAQDGFYDGSGDFTTFADQARQIEEYITENYNGKIHGAYGASQGGLMLTELLTRNKIDMGTVIMDGCYVAHQGKLAGKVTAWMFKKLKNTGKLPSLIMVMMKLMGLKKEDLVMMDNFYMNASDVTVDRNFVQNYTYRTRPEIARNKSKVYLWCGSKEPYAIKSHNELKKYLQNYEEEIMPGFGHGEFLMKHREEICAKIVGTLNV